MEIYLQNQSEISHAEISIFKVTFQKLY